MKKNIFRCIFVMVLTISWSVMPALAQKGGRGQSPGWDRGEKQGWQSATPPGLEDKAPPGEKYREKIREQKKVQQRERNREKVRNQKKTHQGQKNAGMREENKLQNGGFKDVEKDAMVEKRPRKKFENRAVEEQEKKEN